jgi:hypothetical protein
MREREPALRRQGRHERPLAVTDHAEPVNAGFGREAIEPQQRIVHVGREAQILLSGTSRTAGADTALVHPQRGYAPTRKTLSQELEAVVSGAGKVAVPVDGAGAGQDEHGGRVPGCDERPRQRAVERGRVRGEAEDRLLVVPPRSRAHPQTRIIGERVSEGLRRSTERPLTPR